MNVDQILGSLREILRYAYGGLLSFLIAAVVAPTETRAIRETLGDVLSPLCAIALGAFIYAFHRPVLGDVVLSPLAHWAHRKLFAKRWGYRSSTRKGYTCREHLLEERFHVPKSMCVEAYRALRDSELFSPRLRESFHVQHSEFHLLNITALTGFLAFIYLTVTGQCAKGLIFLVAALAVQLFELWGEVLLCRQELIHLLS